MLLATVSILHLPRTRAGDRDSLVSTATRYWLDGPVIESRWGGEIFRTRPNHPWVLTQPPVQ
jgi:hypothetical protein